ncbi:nuclear transport factor 2 family protein [Sinomicrobium sp. FJxs]|uniref:Nuclear transport factor 2 family protein n=2 Tax=Sinomicrobium weinanense TaxID=2842200 RepID=A0A926JSN3_9FLAO|nr:nuclear transport factor 2 family protein [Sinomicrobium weinanense]MBU3125528.1 nuclear transport factor 2 family protein [Sinomicrobium weinanense]
MQRHLNAVTNRDIEALKSTMSPEGKMQLILPGSEIIYSVDGFMDYHKKWFSDSAWTFEAKILNTRIGNKIGMAVAEIMYKEPEREGKPYYNRMIVSYDLEKIDGTWYVIKDHASSVEKSTDKE